MLAGLIEENAARFGPNEALIYGDDRLTHGELAERVGRLAGGLASTGVRPGDNVLVILPNVAEFVIGFFALARLGAAAVVLDAQSKEHELSNALRDCRPTAAITDRQGGGACLALAEQLDVSVTVVSTDDTPSSAVSLHSLIERSDPLTSPLPEEDELLLYQYSSGSTGRPKRVGRTQGQLLAEARMVPRTLGLGPDDAVLCSIPLFHAYGLGDCMLTAMGCGGRLVLQPNPAPFRFRRQRTLELIEEEQVTLFPAVPFMIDLLESAQGQVGRVWGFGSAPPPAPRSPKSSPGGSSTGSASPLASCTAAPSRPRSRSISTRTLCRRQARWVRWYDGVEIVVQDENGAPLPEGEVGTVAVRSPVAAEGYFGAVGGDGTTFRAGWIYPGDLGKLDAEGRLTLAGRTKIFIDVVGHKVDPIEVEDVLVEHPAVEEVVVVGSLEGGQSEVVKAAVVANAPCSERELIHFCAERLAAFKVPRVIEFRESIPRSSIGKVLRKDTV